MTTLMSKFTGTCKRCNRQFGSGTLIDWERGSGAVHHDIVACAAAAATPPPAPAMTVDLQPIVALLHAARARGLKNPKARFLGPNNRELRLSLSGPSSKVPGSLQVCLDDEWCGRVEPGGAVFGYRLAGDQALLALLLTIAMNPAESARAYGALMCRCSFCHLALTDAGSVEVGYGPTCAKKWGLPHQPKGTPTVLAVVA